ESMTESSAWLTLPRAFWTSVPTLVHREPGRGVLAVAGVAGRACARSSVEKIPQCGVPGVTGVRRGVVRSPVPTGPVRRGEGGGRLMGPRNVGSGYGPDERLAGPVGGREPSWSGPGAVARLPSAPLEPCT